MTTYLNPSNVWSARCDGVGLEAGNLLDRFWDAVAFPPSEPLSIRDSFCSLDEPILDSSLFQSPEIFENKGCRAMINVKSLRSPSPGGQGGSNAASEAEYLLVVESIPLSSPIPFRSVHDDQLIAACRPYITLQPASPSSPPYSFQQRPLKPKLSIPSHVQRRINGVSSPGTALLALASNFLGTIVKLGRSQPSTPVAKVDEVGIRIMDSDVLISVVDDTLRAAASAHWPEDGGIEWVDHMPQPGSPDTWAAAALLRSPLSTQAQVGSAEELDALAKINWERQLMNVQGTFWS